MASGKKLFVGGISTTTTKEDLDDFFSKFGKVTETQLLIDRHTGRNRGFGFVTFESEEVASNLMMTTSKNPVKINQKEVELKWAQPREAMTPQPRATRQRFAPATFASYDPTTYALLANISAYQQRAAAAPAFATYSPASAYAIQGALGNNISFVEQPTALYQTAGLQLAAPSPVPAQPATLAAQPLYPDIAAAMNLARAQQIRADPSGQLGCLNPVQLGQLQQASLLGEKRDILLNSYSGLQAAGAAGAVQAAQSQARALAATNGAQGTSAAQATGAEQFLTADPNLAQQIVAQNAVAAQQQQQQQQSGIATAAGIPVSLAAAGHFQNVNYIKYQY